MTGCKVARKYDVYSFGVVLLELLTGRKPFDRTLNPPTVVHWATPLIRKGEVEQWIDPKLGTQYPPAGHSRSLATHPFPTTCVMHYVVRCKIENMSSPDCEPYRFALELARVAQQCLHDHARSRPSMGTVAQMISDIVRD
ncbi:unnamed protein product [Urochloa humidicola]